MVNLMLWLWGRMVCAHNLAVVRIRLHPLNYAIHHVTVSLETFQSWFRWNITPSTHHRRPSLHLKLSTSRRWVSNHWIYIWVATTTGFLRAPETRMICFLNLGTSSGKFPHQDPLEQPWPITKVTILSKFEWHRFSILAISLPVAIISRAKLNIFSRCTTTVQPSRLLN